MELEKLNKAASDMSTHLHRINAPNMKAVEKWALHHVLSGLLPYADKLVLGASDY